MANTYGWAIDLSITKTELNDHLISINLSMPGGSENTDWLTSTSNPIETCSKYLEDKFEDAPIKLFMPSRWTNLNWFLVKIIEGQTPVLIKLNSRVYTSINPDNKSELEKKIDDYLNTLPNTKQNPSTRWIPFDVENTENGRTLVHALAPLSYLPADVSTTLNRSFVYTDDLPIPTTNDAEPILPSKYIVYPEFKIGTDEYKVTEDSIQFTDDIVKIEYFGKNVVFYCNVESKISQSMPTLQLSTKGDDPSIFKSNILTFISPASLFVKSILSNRANLFPAEFYKKENDDKENKKKALIESLTLCLFRSIGSGWGVSRLESQLGDEHKGLYCYENLLSAFVDDKSLKFLDMNKQHKIENQQPQFLKEIGAAIDLLKALSQFSLSDAALNKFIESCKKLHTQLTQQISSGAEINSRWVPDSLLEILELIQNQETLKKISILCWGALNNAPLINLINILQKEISQSILDNAQFALLVESPYIQYTNIAENIRKLEVPNCRELGIALFRLLFGINDEVEKELINTIFQEVSMLISANKEASKTYTKPKDDGLKFSFQGDENQKEDEKYRGYAIALQVSTNQTKWDNASSAWITDVQIGLTKDKTIISEFLHETIGATETNGVPVGSFEYTGNPLVASKVTVYETKYKFVNKSDDKNDDGTDYIDYVWPDKKEGHDVQEQPPKLGYGLWYRGIATPLGNAGEVFDESLRDKSKPTKLIKASDAINEVNNHKPEQYLSCVPPGAPTVIFDAESLTKLQELSEETKAYVYQTSNLKLKKPLPVALLCDEEIHFIEEKCTPSFKLRFHKPIPNIDFLEKWKNGEVSSKINLETFSANLKKFTKLKNKNYLTLNNIPEDINRKNIENVLSEACVHPAVNEVLISVQINGSKNCLKVLAVKKLAELTIVRTTEDLFDTFNLVIKLSAGSFCKIELYSLIKEKLFTGTDNKFNSSAFDHSFKNDNEEITNIVTISEEQYRQFGPAEYWFEAAPNSVSNVEKIDVKVKDEISFVELSIANATQIDATWLRGVEFQRHEWHWTGYPVTFPKVDGVFDEWLSSFVGVESYRQEDNYVLSSYVDADDWKICNKPNVEVVVHQHQLPSGPRPAKYIAFSVRPKIRFSNWIKPKIRIDFESKIFVNGTLAKGIPVDLLQERIPAPPLKWAIPLTVTYKKPEDSNALLPDRTQNGNLLIFEEAFRRTDSLVKFGGIGDTIDIEVMGTRIREIHEFGVNPIFHGYEKLADQTLLCDEPFGLTYDITRNAKVAQTGIVVRPQIADGKWMLTKVRARRFINPDTLNLDNFKKDDGEIQVPMRKVGDSLVPVDFCVDLESTTTLCSLKFGDKVHTGNYALKPASRFLVSFEKFDGQPGWKIGITAQLKNKNLDYETIDRVSSLSDTSLEFYKAAQDTSLVINENKELDYKVRPFITSDYTDPVWLSFIGSFSINAKFLKPDDCSIRIDGENLVFKTETVGLINHFNTPAADSACFQALMVYEPVQDIYKTGKELDGGRFVGFYVYQSRNEEGATFVKTANTEIANISVDAYAYLINIQKATAIKQVQSGSIFVDYFKSIKLSELNLMSLLFPEQNSTESKESILRITPEYMGPINISDTTKIK